MHYVNLMLHITTANLYRKLLVEVELLLIGLITCVNNSDYKKCIYFR